MKYSAAIRNRFEQAVACFGQAQHERAHALCLQVLDRHPDHGDALHLLGVICLRNGRAVEAADWLQRALDNNPDQAESGQPATRARHAGVDCAQPIPL